MIFPGYEKYPSILEHVLQSNVWICFPNPNHSICFSAWGWEKPPCLHGLDFPGMGGLPKADRETYLQGWLVDCYRFRRFHLMFPVAVAFDCPLGTGHFTSLLRTSNPDFTNKKKVHSVRKWELGFKPGSVKRLNLLFSLRHKPNSPLCWELAKCEILFLLQADSSKSSLAADFLFSEWLGRSMLRDHWGHERWKEDFVMASFLGRVLELEKRIWVFKLAPWHLLGKDKYCSFSFREIPGQKYLRNGSHS